MMWNVVDKISASLTVFCLPHCRLMIAFVSERMNIFLASVKKSFLIDEIAVFESDIYITITYACIS